MTDLSKWREELAEVLAHHVWDEVFGPRSSHAAHHFHAFCAVCAGDTKRMADALLPVLARVVAEAKAEALREAAEAIKSRDGRVDAGWLRTFGLRAGASGQEGDQ